MEEMGLDYQFDQPLAGMVTRLTYQKGIDLVQQALPDCCLSREPVVIVLGSGESEDEQFFHWLQGNIPGVWVFTRASITS